MALLHERRNLLGNCLGVRRGDLGNASLVLELGALVEDFHLFLKAGRKDEQRYQEFVAEANALKQRYQETQVIDACLGYFRGQWGG